MRKPVRFALAALLSCAVAAAAAMAVFADEATKSPPPDTRKRTRFSPDAVALFAKLPVQDGGRVKPFSTFAGFTLLAVNGKQGYFDTPAEERLSATEWLMDVLFFPEVAVRYDAFLIEAWEVADAIGVGHEGKKARDHYSYAELEPGLARLSQLGGEYSHVDAKDRTPVEGMIVNLAANIRLFESVRATVELPANGPTAEESRLASKMFGPGKRATLAPVLQRAGELRALIAAGDDEHAAAEVRDDPARSWFRELLQYPAGMALVPPGDDSSEWYAPGAIAAGVLFRGEELKDEVAALAGLQAMYESRGDDAAFRKAGLEFRDRVVARAEARGEYGKIPLEVAFYKGDFFYRALYAFGFGFLAIAFSWMRPSKWLTRSAVACVVAGLAFLTVGITLRCIIRSRPPVSTLYETILFITAVAVLVMLVTEYMNRKGVALVMAALLGAGGMFLANRYEDFERQDTMPSLQAVLDTNFWLATHVTAVTIGYSAGLLAGAVGHIYVLGKLFGFKRGDPAFYKSLTSMTYGMLCFGLVFSVVGTILGGIWANDSWGRFWGWDPKENGALVIVLWELIILHSRMAGRIRDFGIAMASVFGAAVVASSWWGVNLLGVGLHSYGFAVGIGFWLKSYYLVEAAVLVAGGVWWWMTQRVKAPSGVTV